MILFVSVDCFIQKNATPEGRNEEGMGPNIISGVMPTNDSFVVVVRWRA